jgi:hypothetical protein
MARFFRAEHLGAAGLGALEAAVGTRPGPMGISAAVYTEGAGLAVGFFGGMLGIPAELRDGVLSGALALAAKRVTSAAISGKLLAGPKAWGGDGDSYPAIAGGDYGGDGLQGGGGGRVFRGAGPRLLGRGGGFSLYPVSQEAAGVAG